MIPDKGPRSDGNNFAGFVLQQPVLMGILNVTPDSFYDGGAHFSTEAAIRHGLSLAAAGAGIIDIGGESTRPGASPVSWQEEWTRIEPVIDGLMNAGLILSVDTRHAEIMRAALKLGVPIINDVTALEGDPDSLRVIGESDASVVLMHGGAPKPDPGGDDIVHQVCAYLRNRIEVCRGAGIDESRIVVDPGFGFGKSIAENFELLDRLREVADLGFPLLAGLSRKFGKGKPPAERLSESLLHSSQAVSAGAHILRVHDVAETADYLGILP